MNKKRLLNVVRALRESKHPECFSMVRFKNSCGTPACALGHYASRRDLQRTFKIGDSLKFRTNYNRNPWYSDIARHFDITIDDVGELFSVSGCGEAKTTKEAIKYILKFIKTH